MILENDSQRWRTLYEISRYLHEHEFASGGELLQGALEILGNYTGLRSGCIITFDDNDSVQDALTLDMDAYGPQIWEHLYQRGLLGYVHHSQRLIVIRDINHDARWVSPPPGVTAPKSGSAVGVPLRAGEQSIGAMLFIHPQVDGFNGTVTAMLEEIGVLLAQIIIKTRTRQSERDINEQFQWLFEDAITPVVITNIGGKIIKANREASRFLGYDRAALIGMSMKDIHLSRRRTSSRSKLTSFQTNHLAAFETHIKSADGEEIPVRLKVRKRWYKDESVIEYVMQDIRSEVELDDIKRDLTAMIFHDLRGPLQNIKYSLAALKRMTPAEPRTKRAFVGAESSITQLNRMIASLLDVQRLEGGNTILNRKIVPFGRVLRDALDQTNAIADAAGLSLKVDIRDDMPMLDIDPDMIQRVITNLIENATKYAADGGQVILRLRSEVGQVHIIVEDDGPGIPSDMLDNIFDKFSRIKHEDAPHGIGLGLAFCRLAVQAHDGRIWVESEPGNGAAFHFTIPSAPAESPRTETATSSRV